MPNYRYRCLKCEKVFDRLETMAAHVAKRSDAIRCPKCKSQEVARIIDVPFVKTSKKS